MNGYSDPTLPPYAFWRRLLAFWIDNLVLELISLLIGIVAFDGLVQLASSGKLVGFGLAVLYFGIGNSRYTNGQTLGKRLLKVKVVNRDGKPITLRHSFIRGFILSLICFPFISERIGGLIYQVLLSPWTATSPILMVIGYVLTAVQAIALYLFIFNRRTRQTLHDLAVQSYVVHTNFEELNPRPIWKIHWLIGLALGIAISAINPPAYRILITDQEAFSELAPLQQTLQNREAFNAIRVNPRLFTVNAELIARTLEVSVALKHEPESRDRLLEEIVQKTAAYNSPNADFNALLINMNYGYDIGFTKARHLSRNYYCWVNNTWAPNETSQELRVVETPNLLRLEFSPDGDIQAWFLGRREQDNEWLNLDTPSERCARPTQNGNG